MNSDLEMQARIVQLERERALIKAAYEEFEWADYEYRTCQESPYERHDWASVVKRLDNAKAALKALLGEGENGG